MNIRQRLLTATLAAAAAAVPAATAGPLKKDWVAADAQWLIHVDVEGLVNSTIGRFLLDHADRFDIDLDELEEFKTETGFDPLTDLKSATLYGSGGEPGEDGVLVAVTSDRVDAALERLLDNDEVPIRKREMNGRVVYLIGGGDDRHYLTVEKTGRDRRIVVLGDRRRMLADALKVIAGDAPSLSMGKTRIPRDDPQNGSLIFVSIGDIEALGHSNPASEIIRMSDGLTADVGERDDALVARASVSAESPEIANDIAQVIQGMVALGRLMAAQNPDLGPVGELADSLSVRAKDARITLKITCETDKVIALLEHVGPEQGHGHYDRHDDDRWSDDDGEDEDP